MTDKTYLPEGCLIGSFENSLYTSTLSGLEKAMKEKRIIEGIVKRCNCSDMSLIVELPCCTGIIPHEEAVWIPDGKEIRDIAIITRVGKPVSFIVSSIRKEKNGQVIAVLSRKNAQKICYSNFITRLRPGDIIPSKVTHLEPFGAFVDIGCGIVSLMSVDTISVSRISHPSDRLSVGEKIMSVVKSIDQNGRIYMSLRELYGTWEENAAQFCPSQTVSGIIRSVEDYGVFIELTPNLAGLAEPRGFASPGQGCAVYIKSITPEKMKIKLVLIDTFPCTKKEQSRLFIDTQTTKHMSAWRYSPLCCPKIIETVFDN